MSSRHVTGSCKTGSPTSVDFYESRAQVCRETIELLGFGEGGGNRNWQQYSSTMLYVCLLPPTDFIGIQRVKK